MNSIQSVSIGTKLSRSINEIITDSLSLQMFVSKKKIKNKINDCLLQVAADKMALNRMLCRWARCIFAIFFSFNLNVIEIEIYIVVDVVVAIRHIMIVIVVHGIVQCTTQLQQISIASVVGIVVQLAMAASGGWCGGGCNWRCMRMILVHGHICIGIEWTGFMYLHWGDAQCAIAVCVNLLYIGDHRLVDWRRYWKCDHAADRHWITCRTEHTHTLH